MEIVTHPEKGLFPLPNEITLDCDCPDWATMCKHVAAVLYGIGARLDNSPELLFLLRGVDHTDLISKDINITDKKGKRQQVGGDLSNLFGIDLDSTPKPRKKPTTPKAKTPLKKIQKPTTKKATAPKVKKRNIRPSGKTIARLRKKFIMSKAQFALLIGVSTTTITNWEKNPERLNLKAEYLETLAGLVDLDSIKAHKMLKKR